eukprot:GEMP01014385.1.p1 GENE.GEMP01014385.1~~GEMP01014385.1.p1  ORF type:complete len:260 (+),score=44.66 GEMP01014385.1:46-780(+)
MESQIYSRIASFIPALVRTGPKPPAPSWKAPATEFFDIFPKLMACSPYYQKWFRKCNPKDLKKAHVFMNEGAQIALSEYYLCCALKFRPDDVDRLQNDSPGLLKLANNVAMEDVEPFLQRTQTLVNDYDAKLHQSLEESTRWRGVDEGLFLHHNFLLTAPEQYAQILEKKPETVEDLDEKLAREVFTIWIEKSGMPIKGKILNALIDFNYILGVPRAWESSSPSDGSDAPTLLNMNNAREWKPE